MDGSNMPTDRMWKWLNRGFSVHARMYRLTRGVVVGAKTGTRRITPRAYVPDGPNVVVVASKGGNPRHPAWFHNLRANPDTTVQIGSEVRTVRARVATPEERERLWPKAVSSYRPYASYQRKTTREIPLVILEPR